MKKSELRKIIKEELLSEDRFNSKLDRNIYIEVLPGDGIVKLKTYKGDTIELEKIEALKMAKRINKYAQKL